MKIQGSRLVFSNGIPIFERIFIIFFLYLYMSVNFTGVFVVPYADNLRWIAASILGVYSLLYCRKKKEQIRPNISWLILITATVFPSLLDSANLSISVQRYISVILFFSSVALFFNRQEITHNKHDVFIKYLATLYVILAPVNLLSVVLVGEIQDNRYLGITGNSNSLGMMSNMSYVFAIYLGSTFSRNKLMRVFFNIVQVISLVLIVLSGSRNALVVLVINYVYILVVIDRPNNIKNVVAFLGKHLALILGFFLLLFTNGITAINRLVVVGFGRDELWQTGITMFQQKPWAGWGFRTVYWFNVKDNGLGFHNSYLEILVETGVIGATFFGILLVSQLYFILASRKYILPKNRLLYSTALLLLIDILVSAVGESHLSSVGGTEGMSFWFLLIMLKSYTEKARQGVLFPKRE